MREKTQPRRLIKAHSLSLGRQWSFLVPQWLLTGAVSPDAETHTWDFMVLIGKAWEMLANELSSVFKNYSLPTSESSYHVSKITLINVQNKRNVLRMRKFILDPRVLGFNLFFPESRFTRLMLSLIISHKTAPRLDTWGQRYTTMSYKMCTWLLLKLWSTAEPNCPQFSLTQFLKINKAHRREESSMSSALARPRPSTQGPWLIWVSWSTHLHWERQSNSTALHQAPVQL